MTPIELLAAALGLALLFATRLSIRPTYEETDMPNDDLAERAAPYRADLGGRTVGTGKGREMTDEEIRALLDKWDNMDLSGTSCMTLIALANAALEARAGLADLQRSVDYWGARTEKAEAKLAELQEFADAQIAGHGDTMRQRDEARAELAAVKAAADDVVKRLVAVFPDAADFGPVKTLVTALQSTPAQKEQSDE